MIQMEAFTDLLFAVVLPIALVAIFKPKAFQGRTHASRHMFVTLPAVLCYVLLRPANSFYFVLLDHLLRFRTYV